MQVRNVLLKGCSRALSKNPATHTPLQVIHGRYDILAAPKHGEALAKKMCCRLVMLEGAHFVTRECGTELNSLLRAIIFPAQASAGCCCVILTCCRLDFEWVSRYCILCCIRVA